MKKISELLAIRALSLGAVTCTISILGHSLAAQSLDELTLRTNAHFKSLSEGYVNRSPRPMIMDVLRDIYFRSDVNASGDITVEDALTKQRLDHAKRRKSHYSFWAEHDVDGDTVVTIEEIRQTYLPEARGSLIGLGVVATAVNDSDIEERLNSKVADLMGSLSDTNGDGTFTFEEMVSAAEARYPASREGIAQMVAEKGKRWSQPIIISPIFDVNDDGTVTQDEFLAPYEAVLNTYDTDGDGALNALELEPLVELVNGNFETLRSIEPSYWLD